MQAVKREKASLALKRARRCDEACVEVVAIRRLIIEDINDLLSVVESKLDEFSQNKDAIRTTVGPRTTIAGIVSGLATEQDRLVWAAKARIHAIIGGCQASLPSVKSGLRCYSAFARRVLHKSGIGLPPTIDDLLAFSGCFRSAGTFSNYVSYVKVGCLLVGADTSAFYNTALQRAKRSIEKRFGFKKRPKMFVQQNRIKDIMVLCDVEDVDLSWGMLFLVTYVFLLRLPSEAGWIALGLPVAPALGCVIEALPIARGCIGSASHGQAMLYMEGKLFDGGDSCLSVCMGVIR